MLYRVWTTRLGGPLTTVIGVTASHGTKASLYQRRIHEAGGQSLLLRPREVNATEIIQRLDGLLFTGGPDVHPRHYGQAPDPKAGLETEPSRDALELELLHCALDRGIPVLGICRGCQLLNVALGGALIQDLGPGYLDHRQEGRRSRIHEIEVLPDTRLSQAISAAGRYPVNSIHHQGFTREMIAPGLRASALAPDGLVEAVETVDGPWVLGVQFHPERRNEAPKSALGIFTTFVAQANSLSRSPKGKPAALLV